MTRVRLMVREMGQRELVEIRPGAGVPFTDAETATMHAQKMCFQGSVEEFEVWELRGSYRRRWTLDQLEGQGMQEAAE